MATENFEKAGEIFQNAIEIEDLAQRERYLENACKPDQKLRAEVEALLRAHEKAEGFLEVAGVDSNVTPNGAAQIEGPGTKIGRYELLQLIGEGGMGLVYLAEQKEPVKRRVALKIIKPGMDSKQVVARFEAERQVLALLDHPNIARVLDAGTTETGRPYFVMEYVKGLSITQYCDHNKLNIEQRLKLFRQVCEGVHHAHQKGIIHRDLKPSNILVSIHGDRAIPKIIDFGIAKATTQPLTDKTVFTYQGQLLGTPEYMSPEQVDLAMQDIDIRSDIYSLGVVLYELLAGVLPFERESLARLGFAEVQRTIREQEPASPSIRLTNLGEQANTIAARRGTQAVPLARRLHRELEWIPLKAMRKDRCRRYRSAAELADDVQNYLDGNPLTAGPETAVYRVKKFVRRHAGSVATAALIAVTIIVGLVVSTAMYLRAEDAHQKETAARVEAEQAKEKETLARTQAQLAEQATKEKAEELHRNLYVNSIQLADAKYREGNTIRVRELLESCPNDLRGWEWNRLNYIQDESLMTLHLNQDGVWDVAFSPDGRHIITGGEDSTIKVWDAQTGAETMTLRGHEDWIESMAFSPDGQRIVSGSGDGTIRLWNAQSGAELMTLQGHRDWIRSVAFSPDGKQIASASNDRTIKLWDAQTGTEMMTFRGHRNAVSAVAFSPDGKRIVSGAEDETIKVWDIAAGIELLTISDSHKGPVRSVALSPDGRRIVSGSRDGTIKVWNAETGNSVANIAGHEGTVSSVSFSPNGNLIASCGYDHMVKIWDAETGEGVRTFRGHDWMVEAIAFSSDGKHLVSAGGEDDTVKLWDITMGRESTTIHVRLYDPIRSIAFSPDANQIASCSWDSIGLWDTRTSEPIRTIRGDTYYNSVVFSPDGRYIASGSREKGVVRVWNALTGTQLMALRGHKDGIMCITFSYDGKYVISGSDDKTIKLWDATSGSEVRTFQGHKSSVWSVAFSPDGKQIVSGSEDKTIKLWDAARGSEIRTFERPTDRVLSVAVSPDGKRVVAAEGKEIKIRDALTGAVQMIIHGHSDFVFCVAFSPDGKRILSGSRDGTAKLWDPTTGDELITFRERSGVSAAVFSPDGNAIAAGTFDGNVVFWESTPPAGGYEPRKNAETASRLVEKLYGKCGSYHDVINRLQGEATIDPAVHKVALQIANTYRWKDADTLRSHALATVSLPDKDVKVYQAALEEAGTANALEPNDPAILNTLGAAQYRLGSYEDALKTLARSAQTLSDAEEEPDPTNLAFTAMTLHKISRMEEAKVALRQLRELCKQRQETWDMDVQALLAEAEELIESKKPN